jgi:hypothetical protein
VQPQHVVGHLQSWAIYNRGPSTMSRGVVKLSTTASGVHVPKETSVQRAAMRLTAAVEAEIEAATGVRRQDASVRC